MPKSKRNRAVTLSKTKKKGREHEEAIAGSIKQALEDYTSAYVFTFENRRNLRFKEFREQLKSNSRFFLGSNKVMQVALGRSVADEVKPGSHRLSKLLRGDSGLFFTNMDREEVQRVFEKYEEHDFARTGSISNEKEGVWKLAFYLHSKCSCMQATCIKNWVQVVCCNLGQKVAIELQNFQNYKESNIATDHFVTQMQNGPVAPKQTPPR